jgi:hypothetical protein
MAEKGKPRSPGAARGLGNVAAVKRDTQNNMSVCGRTQSRNSGGATLLDFPGGGPIEIAVTRDVWRRSPCGGWGSFPAKPPGPGWVIVDSTHDKRSTWRRLLNERGEP